MATINGSTNSSSYIIWLNAYEADYSITNNTSTVVVELYMQRTVGSYAYNGGSYSGSITVDGATQGYSGTLPYPTSFSQGESKRYATLTFYNVGHNADGSKTVGISASYSADFSPSSGSASGNLTLTTIPRASSVNSVSAYIEGQTNITINTYASFSHSVRIYFGNINKWLQSDGTLGTNEYIFPSSNTRPLFILPSDFYDEFTTERGTGTIYVNTYNGSTKIGERNNSLTAICNPALCNPYATATVVDVNAKTIEQSGGENNVIRYKSNVKITPTITVSSPNDTKTTLKSKAINGTIFTSDSVTITNPNDKSFTLKLINSRNMSSEIIVEATGKLIPYIPLTFSGDFWRPEPTTGEVKVKYSGNIFNDYFDENKEHKNSLTITWKYREKNTTDYIEGGTLSPKLKDNTYSGEESLGTIFDYRKQYEFIVLFSDTISDETSTIYPVIRGLPIFWWSKDGVHIMNKLYVGDSKIGGLDFCELISNSDTTVCQNGSDVTITDWGKAIDYGDYTADTTSGELVINNTELVCLSGKIAGNGYAVAEFVITDSSGNGISNEQIGNNRLVYQFTGNGYWSAPLSTLYVTLDADKTYYVSLRVRGYNQNFTLNSGFGKYATYINALKIK